MSSGGIEYSNVAEIKGPLVIVDGVENAAFDELVEIETKEGEHRLGKVLEIGNGKAIIQVFEGTTGLSIAGTSAKFVGKVMEMPVSKERLGRVFDGLGRPKDGLPEPIADIRKHKRRSNEPRTEGIPERLYPNRSLCHRRNDNTSSWTKTSHIFRLWYVT